MAEIGKTMRWSELEDEEEGEEILPPKEVIGPDENGIKRVIEYKINEEGNKVKITRVTRIRKIAQARLSKHALERRSWLKFGDAVHEDVGARLTMISTEEILLERPKAPGTQQEETRAENPLGSRSAGGALMVCRTCGKKGDHWTSRCPYKDLAQPTDGDNPPLEATINPGDGTKGTYVPPRKRLDGDRLGLDMRRRNDENSVRVTNLSEDTREQDLHDLFRPFGPLSRASVVMDKKTGVSRGFGFVNFLSRDDGERAINKLNGYGYDNLILKVEWAAPRFN